MPASRDYDQPDTAPATPPVIDAAADPVSAAELADRDGDSDHPGRRKSANPAASNAAGKAATLLPPD